MKIVTNNYAIIYKQRGKYTKTPLLNITYPTKAAAQEAALLDNKNFLKKNKNDVKVARIVLQID